MSVNFDISELPDSFCKRSHSNQLIIIHGGENMFSRMEEGVHKSCSETMSAEETARMQHWIEEGRKLEKEENVRLTETTRQLTSTIEALRVSNELEVSRRIEEHLVSARAEFEMSKMKEIAELKERLISCEVKEKMFAESLKQEMTTIETLRASMEKETSRRVEERIQMVRTECEMSKMKEVAELRERLFGSEMKEKMFVESLKQEKFSIEALRASIEKEKSQSIELIRAEIEMSKMKEISSLKEQMASQEVKVTLYTHLEESITCMKEKIESLELLNVKLREEAAAKKKSSHAIGKEGEITVLGLLESAVIPTLPYSYVKDMSSVAHSGDFHLSVMLPNGKMGKILIDSKNYQDPIDVNEINKLTCDVDKHEDITCGMMISLESPISNTKQIQIKKTPKLKPIIYLSLQNLDNNEKKSILCGAVNTLISFVGESITFSARDSHADIIQPLVTSIKDSIKNLDTAIASQTRTTTTLITARDKLNASLSAILKDTGIESIAETYTDKKAVKTKGKKTAKAETAGGAGAEGCIAILRATGMECGAVVVSGFKRCKEHLTSKEREGMI